MPQHLSKHVLAGEYAYIAARLAWLHEDDEAARGRAIQACRNVNVDYIDNVAKLMERQRIDANTARYLVAEALRKATDNIRINEAFGGYPSPPDAPEGRTPDPEGHTPHA